MRFAIASSSLVTGGEIPRTKRRRLKHRHWSELELPPVKIHCSILAEDAVKPLLRITSKHDEIK
ncbi:hypothetical protein KCP76_02475 [Salmonella enterica subsp. enterica serovar Weltevreden]|nr:hypothetical protein KCP76_02475 [Salmonella enterica subsp. enterica serovar Weltevreden]